jgi:hypothetical protein
VLCVSDFLSTTNGQMQGLIMMLAVSACVGWGTGNINGDWAWRSIALMQIVPSVIQISGIWFIPESPRFLVNKDRHEEALAVLAKWHAGGNRLNPTVQFEYREIKETIRVEKEADHATSYLDFFRTKGNRWRLAIIVSLGVISQYSGNALFSNYMNAVYLSANITDQNMKLALSTGNTILNLIVTITAALSVDKFGRRPLFLVSTFGMVVSCACWTVTGAVFEMSGGGTQNEGNLVAGYAQLAFIWIFGIFYDIGFSGLLVAYALEILPFHLRAKGMMLMNMVVQAILALSKYVTRGREIPFQMRLISFTVKPICWRGRTCPIRGTSCCSTPAGISSSSSSSGSSTSRPRGRLSKRSHASLTVMMLYRILTFTAWRRR